MKKIRSGALLLAVFMLLQAALPVTAAAPSEAQEQQLQAGNREKKTQITATVPSAAPSYYLTLPESVALGELDATRDYTQDYTVGVQVKQLGNLKLKITSEQEMTYKNVGDSSKQMTGYNSFGTQYFTADGEAKGTLRVYKEEIAKVPKGTYTGKLTFYSSFVTSTGADTGGMVGEDKADASGTVTEAEKRGNGTYTAKVSVRKSDNINSASMCAPMFYEKADLKVDGSNTKVTIYVIDPIPQYASEGTPLSGVKITANGAVYSGSMAGSKVSRYFAASEPFISKAGNYYATPITFTIPTSAIEKSAEGTVKMSAYVNAVMKSTQEFYLVFSDWKGGETKSSGTATEIEKGTVTTPTATGSTAKNTGLSTAGTTSGSVADGEYLVPVTALKEKTEEASMMADYLYPKATLKVAGKTTTLTIYIQHTVAGMEGGGPEWISYQGTKAVKVSNAMEASGVSYDSFTFTLNGEVPSPMLVSMYINAMKLEVKARLVFDFAKKTAASGTSLETALKESTEGTAAENTAKAEENETDNQGPDSNFATDARTKSGLSKTAELAGYELVTDAGWLGGIFLTVTALIGGAAAMWQYKKRRKNIDAEEKSV